MSSNNLNTRNRILEAALHLLESGEDNSVRMSDIAKRAKISRQALYLHFATRVELLIATTHYLDELKGADARLAPSRAAQSGVERLEAYIETWGNYIPEIYGVAKALLAMQDKDEAAADAWSKRMQDMREGCEAAVMALKADGNLSPDHTPKEATDILWTLLSIRNWEQFTVGCGWSKKKYIEELKAISRRLLIAD